MKKKELEPNYEILFRSAVTSSQLFYNEYKKALIGICRNRFINNDGRLSVIAGEEERIKKAEEIKKALEKALIEVEYYRNMLEAKEQEECAR